MFQRLVRFLRRNRKPDQITLAIKKAVNYYRYQAPQ